ncbi:MAG: hypothetical protein CW691_11120 [Candidatus Bathyarchaeum sp.]|nr:MAG: hypothetical protein CW691_11120 [Candidatus Bathyarchaeum sp.]
MKKIMVAFLVILYVSSLCAVTTQVQSQDTNETVYILSDGSIYSTTNSTVPIQKDGNVYTFTADLFVYTLVIQRNGITIDGAGFGLKGEGDIGIELTSVQDVTVKNVELTGRYYYGIYITEASYNTITENTIKNTYTGIIIYNSTQNTVADNILEDNEFGIDLRVSTENLFRTNNLDNRYNIAIYGTELSHFINDMDDSNTIGGTKKVCYLVGEQNQVITPDTFGDIGFLALVSCTNITVQNVELSNNGQGIILAVTTGSKIVQSRITDNSNGVMLFASSNNVISGNTIKDNVRGIQLSMFSSVNSISLNNITDNTGAMFLFNSSQNTISGNTLASNEYGIGFSASSYNLIMGNHFLNNEIQVYDSGTDDSTLGVSINTWHVTYPAGGNYWSDYAGIDVKTGSDQDENGSDGIGDTAYVINSQNKDNYPLIIEGSFYVYITSPENKTYTVNSVSLTYTASETDAVVSYSLDGQATTTISASKTLSDLSEGSHELTVFAQDTQGNEDSHTVYFTISEEADTPAETEDQTDDLPITLIVAVIAIVAVVGVALFYFMKMKNK